MALLFPLLTIAIATLSIYAVRMYTTPGVGAIMAEQARGAEPPAKPFIERWILPLARRLVPTYRFALPFVNRRHIRQRLAAAGDPYGLKVNDVVQLKIASGMIFPLLLALDARLVFKLSTTSVLVMTVAAVLPCFFIPDWWLSSRATDRQTEITLSLPDFMDLMAISIAAGVGFDLALHNIVARMHGALAEELERMIRQLRLGHPRRLTYRKVIWRNDSQALRAFFSALVQADELGTPIADILEWQAETLRHQRIQEARRRGAKASAKISLIMSTVLLFSLVLVLLGAVALNLLYGKVGVFG